MFNFIFFESSKRLKVAIILLQHNPQVFLENVLRLLELQMNNFCNFMFLNNDFKEFKLVKSNL